MKRLRIQIIVVVTIVLLLVTVSIVSGRGNANPRVLPPNFRVQGLTYGERSAECSTVEEDPFYGGNEEQMRACALGFTITDLQASIDGLIVKNLSQYIHTSPLFEFTLPEDNILFIGKLSGQSVSNGAHLMLAPLSPGEHTIYLHASIPELEFTVDMNFDLTVVQPEP